MNNCMIFGTSILEGFWTGFGRVFGDQNPGFSHFCRCFFEVIFEARFGRAKSRPKRPNKTEKAHFESWAPVIPRPVGKGKDRGKNFRSNCAKECRDWPAVIGQSQFEMSLARRWHTFGGRRIETPRGGTTAAHPFLAHL